MRRAGNRCLCCQGTVHRAYEMKEKEKLMHDDDRPGVSATHT